MKNKIRFTFLSVFLSILSFSQNSIFGIVKDENGKGIQGANIYLLEDDKKGTTTDFEGRFIIDGLKKESYNLVFSYIGYETFNKKVKFETLNKVEVNVLLKTKSNALNEVVISGTRYLQNRVNNPVVVGVIDDKIFNATQSITISEGLNYNSGVRVETNCQNCGFTQVRLNGLEGAYSQILINSRPIFSALNSVYGLEQIPTNIVERVEVVRGGGSALYGSNAIAGTVNIITKDPVENSWEISSNTALIDGDAIDQTFKMNGSIVSESLNSGITLYGMSRNRDSYDADGDGFTELVELENTVFGAKAFFTPGERSNITFDFSALEEYRRGGDQLDLAPHFTNITEQLQHNTIFGGISYDQWSKNDKNKWSIYLSSQRTKRDSYYGGLGGSTDPVDQELALNSYGLTEDFAFVTGVQFVHFFEGEDVITAGVENQIYDTEDEIRGFNRFIDQNVNTTGIFAQYEWKPKEKFTALIGGRYDITNVDGSYRVDSENTSSDVNFGVFSPRISFLYKLNDRFRFRTGYARGFRAPQAYNEDLHISSAGGEQVISILSNNLDKEISDAFTASINYTKVEGIKEYNFLVEGFYTDLSDPFTTVSTGNIGSIILEEVINGQGATVTGVNFEAGYSPSEKFNFQVGGTYQNTNFDENQELFNDGTNSVVIDEFVRNPDFYGFFNSFYNISEAFKIDLTGTYTGSMIVPRVTGSDGFISLVDTDQFFDMNLKASYNFKIQDDFNIELSGGFRNIFDSYQSEFDQGPKRDSDFIFGPAAPRSVFLSIKIGSL